MDFDFSTLITDRSASDLELLRDLLSTPMSDWTAEQLAQFNQALSKGAYNYTDLNRVTACMDYLNERLTALGYVTGYQRIVVHPEEPPGPVGPLPEGYTELEYIQSSGTQYIDTGFKPNQDTRVEIACVFNAQATASWLFGARAGTYVNTFNFLTNSGDYRSDYGNGVGGTPFSLQSGEFHLDKNGPATYINSVLKDQGAQQEFTSSYNLYLFANNNSGNVQGRCAARIFSAMIYDGENPVRDFIPCKSPSGEIGFYDIVTAEFYGNAGSGVFTAGPEVGDDPEPDPSPDPSKDPYTWYESDTPTQAQMTQYLANVEALNGALALADNTPDIPQDMDGLTLAEANVIEQILDTINDYLVALQKIFLRSDMVWAISSGPGFYFTN